MNHTLWARIDEDNQNSEKTRKTKKGYLQMNVQELYNILLMQSLVI